ncbi:MAG: segregation and condensation protein A [Bacillota bacterium]|uniref:Segregation and condensation protein A n=1 Tax=Thermanaerosceptrum fracticalcis TaxID=1712410 RepID=A0A7G6E0H5_THEFR|nr:segregation/condensation protein A [Thermanaerosceptrum fracticalcis]QNB45579.1 segregation/condensation protein A [Thermanaerosceptrum fracticalcis]
MSYKVQLPVFEGPLDLLLHLIDKNEVDIYDIPIALITQQYLEYLSAAEELDLELTSEFLIMASTLLSIKARMLLPKSTMQNEEEFGGDPREELVEKLLEYKIFKETASVFKEMEYSQAKIFMRHIDEAKLLKDYPPPNPVGDVTLQHLIFAFHKVLARIEKKKEVLTLPREQVTIRSKISYILLQVKNKPLGLPFRELFTEAASKEEVIVTFLALLELIRLGRIHIKQPQLFEEILIFSSQIEGGHTSAHAIS